MNAGVSVPTMPSPYLLRKSLSREKDMKTNKVDHICIAVRNLEAARKIRAG